MSRTLPSPPPAHVTLPRVGSLKPAMMRSAVDLPQPDGPSSERNSPSRTSRSKLSSATTPLPNTLPTPRSETMGAAEIAIDCYLLPQSHVGVERNPALDLGGVMGGEFLNALAGRL